MTALDTLLREEQAAGAQPQVLVELIQVLIARYGSNLIGILYYGSCRGLDQLDEGLVDLCLIVEDYRQLPHPRPHRWLNACLPPNVYYIEHAGIRSKYAVIQKDHLERKINARWDHYFWARFAQPTSLVYVRNEGERDVFSTLQKQALCRFYQAINSDPHVPTEAQAMWAYGLTKTYDCELRPESPEHAQSIIRRAPEFWTEVTPLVAAHQTQTKSARLDHTGHWAIRRYLGKALNIARLLKASATFTNGIDYIVWKVERHSGVKVEPTEWMRRHPRLAGWQLAWQLWRQGGFR